MPERFQGFAGIAHGGILATILDECMVNTVWLRGKLAVTARFEVRLRQPVRVGTRVTFRAEVRRESARGLRSHRVPSWMMVRWSPKVRPCSSKWKAP